MIRPDLIFSYWIFVWYLLYDFVIPIWNRHVATASSSSPTIPLYSPKFALILGVMVNAYELALMMWHDLPVKYILTFIVGNLFLKAWPLYRLVQQDHGRFLRHPSYHDLLATLSVLALYEVWLRGNGQTAGIWGQYKDINTSLVQRQDKTPFMWLAKRWLP